jgi:hypothetical protein
VETTKTRKNTVESLVVAIFFFERALVEILLENQFPRSTAFINLPIFSFHSLKDISQPDICVLEFFLPFHSLVELFFPILPRILSWLSGKFYSERGEAKR